jgi:splicing factor U2AF subunit
MYRGRDQGPRGGAEHLARIHGTEDDKVNCPFYFKIGACRHGDKCSRQHHRPPFSQTIIVPHMWANPIITVANAGGDINSVNQEVVQEGFDDFFHEIFEEFNKYGKIEEVQVCENLGDHLVGNVYVKFEDEEFAESALQEMNGRFFAGRQLKCEYCPVTDFKESRCRQFDESKCERGPFCNFMHVREPSRGLAKYLDEVKLEKKKNAPKKFISN